ncbi:MAG: hypothetical protein ACI841_004682, partial [Planctomycetota bacterium]
PAIETALRESAFAASVKREDAPMTWIVRAADCLRDMS